MCIGRGTWLAASFLGLLWLTGCADTPPIDAPGIDAPGIDAPGVDANAAMIAPGRILTLPEPGELGRSVEATQLITIQREGDIYAFDGHISINPERLYLVGVDGLGRRALTVTWEKSGKVTSQTAAWLPKAIMPGPMLADLVMLYWPEAVVRRALVSADAELVITTNGRLVTAGGTEVFQAEYLEPKQPGWTGMLRYRNKSWGYETEVQSVEAQP